MIDTERSLIWTSAQQHRQCDCRRSIPPARLPALLLSFLLFITIASLPAHGAIAFVQGNYAVPSTPQTTVTVPYTAAQTAGNLNVIIVGWADSTARVSQVTDSKGNSYLLAIGPTLMASTAAQSIYYAKNIAAATAGSNSVTVTFTTGAQFPDIRILEYSGIDPSVPVDVTVAATGSSKTSSSGSVATTNANDLLVGANDVQTNTTAAGTGFTKRLLTPDGDIAEDRVVTATGSYSATATLGSTGGWVMQMVAFRAATGGGDTTPPTVPTNLTAQPISSSQISLSWTASTDASSNITYHVERCTGASCATFAEIAAPTTITFTNTGLAANTSYSYRVRASDPSNNFSGYSNTASAITQADTTPPTVPLNLTAQASGTQISLSWTASSDDSGSVTYHVERCQGASCGSFSEITAVTGTTYTDLGLTANTSYSYRVRASDPSNNFSNYSNIATALTQTVSATPTFVQGNSVTPSTPQTTVTVPYTAAQTAGDLSIVIVGWADSTARVNSVTDTKGNAYQLAIGPTFFSTSAAQSIYYAKNISAATAGSNSVTVTFTVAAQYPDIRVLEYINIDPVNPLDVAAGASGSSATANSGAVITTNATDLLVGANDVESYTSAAGSGFTRRLLTPDGDIAEDRVVTATGSYSATATLGSSAGWVMQVAAFRAVTGGGGDTTPPTNPSNLSASATGTSQIGLSWTASSDTSPITYHIERCQGTGCITFAEIATAAVTSFTDTGLTASSSYSYRVRASDSSGNFSGYSNTASATTLGSNPATVGQWSAPFNWPMVGIHTTLMPNGKVLTWEDENASPAAQVWNPSTSAFTAVPYNAFDLFCSGHTVLPDGRVMVAGGHNGANYMGITALTFFNPSTQTWSAGPKMSYARWYPTVTALPDGRQLVTSGAINCEGCNANTPEIYDPVANAWTKLTSATISLPLYPHMFVLPDGRVLVTGSYELPVMTQALDLGTLTWTTIDPNVYDAGSSVMYSPGKILKSGTSANSDPPYVNAVSNAYVLDMTQPSPAWRQTNPMNYARSYHTLTILPDSTVLATGGEGFTNPFDLSTAVLAAEIWSPTTEQWTVVASMQNARVYHSTALLLPDGRVLIAGSGEYGTGSIDQLNGEIYSPPYLFKGSRPTISSAPTTLQYGQQFTVQTPDAASVSSVVLIELGSVTHAFNENQRFVPLAFAAGSGSLTVTAPQTASLATPGYYMLFLVNSAGVPSVATILNLPVPAAGNPPTAPGNLVGTPSIGQVVLSWSASTGVFGISYYNVYRSTTPNFVPASANRLATSVGTTYTDTNFTASGTYYYLVTAVDSKGTESAPSNQATESVSADTTPPAVSLTAPANGATVSGNVAVSASASDDVVVTGVQFQVDGINIGPAITSPPYATSWSTGSVANGSHMLTAIATNGANLSTTSAGVSVTVNNTGPAQISFVQRNYAVPSTPQTTVIVPFTGAQSAGNLNVVVVGWSNSTSVVNSITDTKGNLYVRAVGPTAVSGVESQSIYYAKNIAAAAANGNAVTVTFNTAAPFPDVRILEYSGIDISNPVDLTAAASGNSTTSSSGAVTTTNANDLILGANYVATNTASAGTGFTSRVITNPDGDIVEDRIVSATGSYNATANLSGSGRWIMQMVAFRAAGGAPAAMQTSPK